MSILAGLESFLYVISSALLYPAVAGLALLTVWVALFFGRFLRETLDRRAGRYAGLDAHRAAIEELLRTAEPRHLDLEFERRLQEAELGLVRGLDTIRFVIRVGPALGLMGTLIPMGISLSSLAQGDMPKMAGSMVTAFTTVVVGLGCSIAAYLMALVKEKWVRADIREMEYLTERALRGATPRIASLVEEVRDEVA